jgi:formate hydrogenlyase subunit 3/multisubunit Na+/H+ antiporter MnhD subunit
MEKSLIEIFNLLAFASVILILIRRKGFDLMVPVTITMQVIVAMLLGLLVLSAGPGEYSYTGTAITGIIPVRYDYLSAWFIMIIGFTFLTGTWYGYQYMLKYKEHNTENVTHAVSLVIAFTSLIDICIFQNTLVFLILWEIMALSSFILIIYEHYKSDTLNAGINFLIQSHISILLLTIAFIWVKASTGSFDLRYVKDLTLIPVMM